MKRLSIFLKVFIYVGVFAFEANLPIFSGEVLPFFGDEIPPPKTCQTLLSSAQMKAAAAKRQTERDAMISAYNQSSLGFKAEYVPTHDTIRVFPSSGRIPEDAKARALLIHGMGWNTSTHALWREMTRVLADPHPIGEGAGPSHARRIHQMLGSDRVLVGAEAIDMPGHGVGADASSLVDDLDASVKYFVSYIRMMKEETPDLPIVIVGWSWAGPLAIEIERRHPDLVDGLVLLGITEPGESQQVAVQNFISFADSEFSIEGNPWPRLVMNDEIKIQRNPEGITWISSVAGRVGPLMSSDFVNTPTLFIYGEGDGSVNQTTRNHARDLASRPSPNPFQQIVLPSRGQAEDWRSHEPFHGLFEENSDGISPWSEDAYRALNSFLRQVSLQE